VLNTVLLDKAIPDRINRSHDNVLNQSALWEVFLFIFVDQFLPVLPRLSVRVVDVIVDSVTVKHRGQFLTALEFLQIRVPSFVDSLKELTKVLAVISLDCDA
jgi:hypothetical protein